MARVRAIPPECPIRPFSQSDACARIGKARLSYNGSRNAVGINQTAARQIDNTGRDDLSDPSRRLRKPVERCRLPRRLWT